MTNEQMAALIQSDREEFKELLPILWKKVRLLLVKMSREFYHKHKDSCTRCGVELSDIEGSCYPVYLAALDGYKADKETLFTSYLDYPFRSMTAELLGYRTEKGKNEPLNNCDSLDRAIDTEDSDSTTLGDFIADPISSTIEDDVLECLNREQEALAVRKAVAALPERERQIIELHYFEGKPLREIGEALGMTQERARQIERRGLLTLRRNRQLQLIHYENRQHQRALYYSRFQWSPQYFDLVRSCRERKLSYGKMQAELLAAERRWDEEPRKDADGFPA